MFKKSWHKTVIWPSLFLLGLLFKDVFDLNWQLSIYSFSYCIYHDQETGYGPTCARSSTMIHKGATRFFFQPSNFSVSPIHTVLRCKICNTKPFSPVVNYNLCPQISPEMLGIVYTMFKNSLLCVTVCSGFEFMWNPKIERCLLELNSPMAQQMIKRCPPVILSSGIKEKMAPQPHENTGSTGKITIHLFALRPKHILCLSPRFKAWVNHKLSLMPHLHSTLTSYNFLSFATITTATFERGSQQVSTTNGAAGRSYDPYIPFWPESTPLADLTQQWKGKKEDVTETGSYEPTLYKSEKGYRNSYVRKTGITYKQLAGVSL